MQEEWPLLIIAPASLRLVWAEELERWHPHLRPSQVHVIENRTDRLDISKQLPQVISRSSASCLFWLGSLMSAHDRLL